MKRIIFVLFSIMCMLSLFGCNGKQAEETDSSVAVQTEDVTTERRTAEEGTTTGDISSQATATEATTVEDFTEQSSTKESPTAQSSQGDRGTEQSNKGDITTEETTTEEPEEAVKPKPVDGELELPVQGATGFAAIPMKIMTDASASATSIGNLQAGEAFTILKESGEWWQIEKEDVMGWVTHKNCFINLPDVIPSIAYYDTNAFSSAFLSSSKEIPNISGLQLYEACEYNQRLEKEEYIMPVLYAMSFKICEAQQAALEEDNTLILYEGFRPYEVQQKVVKNLKALAEQDATVDAGISTEPWGITWFIANSLSNHQRGVAIDVSLGEVLEMKRMTTGDYAYMDVVKYEEYQMPTKMHELSAAAVAFQYPVSSKSDTEWRYVPLARNMNEPAILLQQYCTDAGLSPLASEWWHFNDLETLENVRQNGNSGNYYMNTAVSRAPEKE